nr:exportin-5-like [Lytechinus pictus]
MGQTDYCHESIQQDEKSNPFKDFEEEGALPIVSNLQICENFKDTSPHCVACGAMLADVKHSPVIRHFGLQLLEHFVRFKWNDATVEQKLQFKNLTIEMITKKSTNVLEEENFIKEGPVKIVVEMIKREWPQQWPSLLEELDQMCQIGDSQTELVLLILLRLVEDVVSFHNVQQGRRRKDLWQALNANMSQISSFLIKVLEMYSEKYQSLESSAPQSNEAKSACKVTQTVLVTMCGFVEWMDAKHLYKEENRLLIFLYKLLRNEELKMLAAECLQLIVHRKGKIDERKPLMVLFCDVAMTELFNAAVKACSAGLDEKNHLFLKKLCQVITGLGSQMCAIWVMEGESFVPPANLASYLKTLYSFTQHASTHVCHLTSASWMAFLRHEHMSRTQAMLDIIPSLCQTFITTIQKLGYPSRNDSAACAYSRIDFDSDEEFFLFFSSHRYNQLEILRYATALCPETTLTIAAHWLQEVLAAPIEKEEGKELCTNLCPSAIRWDAMSNYLDVVITALIKKDQLPTQQAVELLQATLNTRIEDPVILSFQLTCISTLFPVLYHSKQHVESVLDKLFAAAVFSLPGLTKVKYLQIFFGKQNKRLLKGLYINVVAVGPHLR